MRILLIEDDKQAAAYLVKGLNEAGFNVEHASDGRDGLYLATSEPFDLVIVDRMLPGLDGLAIIQALRAQGHKTPILILSALAQVDDRVRGLRAGGDDYLTKPYSFAELMARIEALLRRGQAQAAVTTLEVAGLHMDLVGRTVARDGRRIELQPLYMALFWASTAILLGFIRYSTIRMMDRETRERIALHGRNGGITDTFLTLFGPDSQTGSSPRTRTVDRGSLAIVAPTSRLAYPSRAPPLRPARNGRLQRFREAEP